jgi:hypothetical protein
MPASMSDKCSGKTATRLQPTNFALTATGLPELDGEEEERRDDNWDAILFKQVARIVFLPPVTADLALFC